MTTEKAQDAREKLLIKKNITNISYYSNDNSILIFQDF